MSEEFNLTTNCGKLPDNNPQNKNKDSSFATDMFDKTEKTGSADKLLTLKVKCRICGKVIEKSKQLSYKQWNKREYCSVKCRQKGRSIDMKEIKKSLSKIWRKHNPLSMLLACPIEKNKNGLD